MSQVSLTINGRSVQTESGNTILQAAARAGIFIPTLCHSPLLKPEEACRICLVQVEGEEKLVASCAAQVADGIVVETDSPVVLEARQGILKLLLEQHYGDCLAPCHLACPAGIDIQGYVAHVSQGEFQEALKLIKEKNPLPLSIGRVCPHFCEDACRRNRVDQPIAINPLKRFVADYDLLQGIHYKPAIPKDTDHKVAIIGGGPGGLSAAYYLRQKGHQVTILDAKPQLGGMLRYAIPEYRLPKKILDQEVQGILDLGVEVRANQFYGQDFTLADLRQEGFKAIFLAVGTWKSTRLGLEGEDLPGVVHALELLIRTAMGNPVDVGQKVLIIGNGNTGMDAARTALRLGAKEVTMLYRRSRKEMTAHHEEVTATEQEGVKLELLVSPTRIISENGRFKALEFIRNELKEPDAGGRARPVPIPGSETVLEADLAVISIGQYSDLTFIEKDPDLKELVLSKWGTPEADPQTLQTSIPDLFVGGDLWRGPQTVIQAIADGRTAALSIHQYLTRGEVRTPKKAFNISKGKLALVDPVNFETIPEKPRVHQPHLPLPEREKNFIEVEKTIARQEAMEEAARCLSCGCQDALECRLRAYADLYQVDMSQIQPWQARKYPIIENHPLITIDPNKCITCRRCVHGCTEYQVQKAFELLPVDKGSEGGPPVYRPFINEHCVSCGYCVGNCPTGALTEKTQGLPGPWNLQRTRTTCTYCGVGCQLYLEKVDDRIVRVTGADTATPPNYGHLCVKGRFGFDFINHPERLTAPLIREGDHFRQASWDEALDLVARRFLEIKGKYGSQALAGLSSARATNEENYLMQKLVRGVFKTNNIDHCARL